VYVFELPFGHCVFSRAMVVGYPPSRGIYFCGIGVNVSQKLVIGWPFHQDVCLWLLVMPRVCIPTGIVIDWFSS
jgi:hypothetical protein